MKKRKYEILEDGKFKKIPPKKPYKQYKKKKYPLKRGRKRKKKVPPVKKYRIVLVNNGRYCKTLYDTDLKPEILMKFRELREENDVKFPKRFVEDKKTQYMKPCYYEILILKKKADNDKPSIVYDKNGNLVEQVTTSAKWSIIESAPYEIEESFGVFGYDYIKERFKIDDVISKLMMKNLHTNNIKTVHIFLNKLIIRDSDLEIVICKNTKDATRLHNKLRYITVKSKSKRFLFLGRMIVEKGDDMYKELKKKTKWSDSNLYRHSSGNN